MNKQADKQTLILMRCNNFLKTREGLKSLLAVNKVDWWSDQEVNISIEEAIVFVQNSWLFHFGAIT